MPGKVKKTDSTGVTPVTKVPTRRRAVAAPPQPAAKPARATARRVSARRQTAGAEPIAVVADRDTSTLASVPVTIPEPTHDEIAERAYFVYLSRNGAPGDPSEDWAQAEYQLRRERGII